MGRSWKLLDPSWAILVASGAALPVYQALWASSENGLEALKARNARNARNAGSLGDPTSRRRHFPLVAPLLALEIPGFPAGSLWIPYSVFRQYDPPNPYSEKN